MCQGRISRIELQSIQPDTRYRRLIPVLAWLALIAVLSTSIPAHDRISNLVWQLLHELGVDVSRQTARAAAFYIRKSVHPIVYGVLALFIALTFRAPRKNINLYILSFIIAVAVGAADEFHQTFIPERSGQVSDVVLNATGVTAALVVYYFVQRTRYR